MSDERKNIAPRSSATARITIALLHKAAADLAEIADESGLSKTDIVNRGVQVFAYLYRKEAEGAEIVIRKADGTTETLLIL
jgi:hypothetical protein